MRILRAALVLTIVGQALIVAAALMLGCHPAHARNGGASGGHGGGGDTSGYQRGNSAASQETSTHRNEGR